MNYSDSDLQPPVLPYEEYLPVDQISHRFVERILKYAQKEENDEESPKDSDEGFTNGWGEPRASDDVTQAVISFRPDAKCDDDEAKNKSDDSICERTLLPCEPVDKYAAGVCTCPVCYKRRQDAIRAEEEAAALRAAEEEAARAAKEALAKDDLESEVEAISSVEYREQDEDWPRISTFSNESIIKMIIKISSSWARHEGWMFCVDYLEHKSDCASDDYIYEVLWSVPTKAHPVPQATASVYFKAHISRISPPTMPVQLTYTFENSCYVHKPDRSIVNFQEKQLINIIQSKIDIYRKIRF